MNISLKAVEPRFHVIFAKRFVKIWAERGQRFHECLCHSEARSLKAESAAIFCEKFSVCEQVVAPAISRKVLPREAVKDDAEKSGRNVRSMEPRSLPKVAKKERPLSHSL